MPTNLIINTTENIDVNGNYALDNNIFKIIVKNVNVNINNGIFTNLLSGLNGQCNALVIDENRNLYAGGNFTSAGGIPANNIAKWDGRIWRPLDSGLGGQCNALVFDSNRNLYAGGAFTTAGGNTVNYIAKWNGSSWSSVGTASNTGLSGICYTLKVDSSNNLYVGGSFLRAGTVTVNNIAKWNGSVWSALGPVSGPGLGTGGSSTCFAITIASSGNLYAGGNFTKAGTVTTNYIAKWNGNTWSSLGVGLGSVCLCLIADLSENVYAGGNFTSAGSVSANFITKWNGVDWTLLKQSGSLTNGLNSKCNALALDASNNLYLGGAFTTADNYKMNFITKWNGTTWSTLSNGLGGPCNALAFDSSGNLYVGTSSPNYVQKYTTNYINLTYNSNTLATLANNGDSAFIYTNNTNGNYIGFNFPIQNLNTNYTTP